MKTLLSFIIYLLIGLVLNSLLWAGGLETVKVSGRIVDIHGEAVPGAEVYIYRTQNVKKPADFISSTSGSDGRYQVALPPGEFYLVAIYRQGSSQVGPLMAGDKHSGDPVQFEFSEDMADLDFQLMDLREAALKDQKINEELSTLRGRLLDDSGKPIALAYAIAHRTRHYKKIPDFFSAWSNSSGEYLLFLPRGKYYLGGALDFPPDPTYVLTKEIRLDGNMSGIDIILEGQ